MKTHLQNQRTLLLSIICLTLFVFSATAQQVKKISVQGFLKDGTGKAVADGPQDITFKLYSTETGGTAAWTGTQTVKVTGGVYSVYLGAANNPIDGLSWGTSSYFVGITVGTGTQELTPRTELTFAPYSLGSPLADRAKLADKATTVVCSGAVGDVKYSILNPTQFALENGNCWVPMDGSSMAGSKLATITGSNTIPDIGGAFVRSQEFSGKADRDPDRTSSSTIATLQSDGMQSHSHGLSTGTVADGGLHTHQVPLRLLSGDTKINQVGRNVPYSFDNYVVPYTSIKFAAEDYVSNGQNPDTNKADVYFSSNNAGSNHSHTLSGNTSTNNGNSANETRPKNFNLWTYIRIN